MSYFEVLFHPDLLMATILYTFMAISFEILYQNFLQKIHNIPGTYWIANHLGLPFFHIILLIGFIYMSYPVLFGLEAYTHSGERVLPTMSQLLTARSGHTMQLINTLFVISVILPLLPLINRFSALILPLQAISGSAMLYGWLARATQQSFSIIPDARIVLIIITASFISELIARYLASVLSDKLNTRYHSHDMHQVVYKSTLLVLQVPILLLYTLNLPRF